MPAERRLSFLKVPCLFFAETGCRAPKPDGVVVGFAELVREKGARRLSYRDPLSGNGEACGGRARRPRRSGGNTGHVEEHSVASAGGWPLGRRPRGAKGGDARRSAKGGRGTRQPLRPTEPCLFGEEGHAGDVLGKRWRCSGSRGRWRTHVSHENHGAHAGFGGFGRGRLWGADDIPCPLIVSDAKASQASAAVRGTG